MSHREQKDIWDEKPELRVEIGEHDDTVYIGDLKFTTEDGEDFLVEITKFDAWLEKVGAEHSRELQLQENELRRIIVERGRKLETIKKLYYLYLSGPTMRVELLKILEGGT